MAAKKATQKKRLNAPDEKPVRSEYLPNIRVEKEVRLRYEKLADQSHMSLSAYIYRVLLTHLQLQSK